MNGLRRVHRGSAIVLALYALVHLANHLAALDGVASHIAFMDAVRGLTRVPAVEALLLACVLVQVGTGLAFLLRRRGGPMPPFLRMQAVSGAYLAFFLLVHVSSVLAGRFVFKLDTNFHYAAAGLHLAPFHFFSCPTMAWRCWRCSSTWPARCTCWCAGASLPQRAYAWDRPAPCWALSWPD
ncbi:hypothetical protein [Massilia sp. Se16.2.3]|uniref:hypothetical protein n=1 Tax=Massilia sp. Se16.2.3 TaxID=2709303 RepID=UPI001602F2FE|nr:hypothetical protein [Massilia sp. Se16.2.3]QNB00616.1 hypothetical protein G4G31_20380 [Massilia sp. Se16.2.3]